jgi:hypothetical protein
MATGAVIGSIISLVLFIETKYVFPIPQSKPAGFLALIVLMGAFIGWACAEFRSRDCPRCGTPMGRPHFPAGERPGRILYQCPNCGGITPYQGQGRTPPSRYDEC